MRNTSKLLLLHREERGQALVCVVAALSLLMIVAGLGVDVGYLRYQHGQMQKSADAGALAGASEYLYDSGKVTKAAQNESAANGFSDGVNNISVTVNSPPTSGTFNGQDGYVQVTVAQAQPNFFMRVAGFNTTAVSAMAVASSWGSASGCIYVLDPSDQDTYTASGSAIVSASCGIRVNSGNTKAFDNSGGACTTASPGGIAVVGNIDQDTCGTTPQTGVAHFSDPLAGLAEPTGWTCPSSPPTYPKECSYSQSGGLQCNSQPSTEIQPGTYCGGITISAAAKTATFAAGTYILAGGGLTASGGVNVYSDGGVMFYNTTDPSNKAGYKPITVSGGTSTTLTAPTSGTYAGILFFQDRNLPSTDLNKQNTISGGSTGAFTGVLYFPTTPLVYSGGGSTTSPYIDIIAWTLTISGSSSFVGNYGTLPNGTSPIHSALIAE